MKVSRRNERTQERAVLILAKRKFYEMYPEHDINDHRWKVTHLKIQIKQLMDQMPELSEEEILARVEFKVIRQKMTKKNKGKGTKKEVK